ncbi:MAG: electron transfer flavoprotein subunit beta/FixA family protein, partial [Clostridia bacterium]|nr:electron transfer flavoprotein subunit beta/FixA family protein [Clostridia bacterium]
MHIVVCLKQIIDPEIPPRDFKIDPERKEAVQGKASLVISTFDEIALEVALQLRDRIGEGKITAISFGAPTA